MARRLQNVRFAGLEFGLGERAAKDWWDPAKPDRCSRHIGFAVRGHLLGYHRSPPAASDVRSTGSWRRQRACATRSEPSFTGWTARSCAQQHRTMSPQNFLSSPFAAPDKPGAPFRSRARAALERRTVPRPDVGLDPEYTFHAAQIDLIRTVLAVPMLKNGELVGSRRKPRLFAGVRGRCSTRTTSLARLRSLR